MWTKRILLLTACWMGMVYGHENLHRQLLQDYIQTHPEEIGPENQVWVINDWIFEKNGAGQWVSVGLMEPEECESQANDCTN